jgi:hypothetical protein
MNTGFWSWPGEVRMSFEQYWETVEFGMVVTYICKEVVDLKDVVTKVIADHVSLWKRELFKMLVRDEGHVAYEVLMYKKRDRWR